MISKLQLINAKNSKKMDVKITFGSFASNFASTCKHFASKYFASTYFASALLITFAALAVTLSAACYLLHQPRIYYFELTRCTSQC